MRVLAIGLTASLLAVTTLLLQPIRPAAVAASRALLELRAGSGAYCFVSGTQNCPPSDDPNECKEYACVENNGVWTCPKPHVDTRLEEDFSDVALGTPGYRKFKSLSTIYCTLRQECELCKDYPFEDDDYCQMKRRNGAVVKPTKTNERTPTVVDSTSDPC